MCFPKQALINQGNQPGLYDRAFLLEALEMAKRRLKFFDSKWFSLVIAVFIFGLFVSLFLGTKILQNLEGAVIDLHFQLKTGRETKTIQEGAVLSHQNLKISDNILILGIDQRSLAEYGKWPFKRTKHSELIRSEERRVGKDFI